MAKKSPRGKTKVMVSKIFICKFCDMNFPSEKERYVHQVDQHWKDLISQCEVCVKSFLLKESPDPSHQCHLQLNKSADCEGNDGDGRANNAEGISVESLEMVEEEVKTVVKKSQRLQARKIFTCKECRHVCKSVLEMLNHKQSHHTVASQCHHCHLSCKNEQSLREHLKLHTKQKWHFCSVCSEGFEMEGLLQEHKRLQHGEDESIPSADPSEEYVPSSLKNQTVSSEVLPQSDSGPKKYACRYCMQKFTDTAAYQEHVKISHPRKFECSICQRSYVRRCELKLHMKHHCEDRNFVCQYCGKTFKRQAHLDCHILSHTGEKKFECKQCGKSFKAKRTLIGHEMKHSGNQPFQCKHCGIKFTLKSSLLKHESSHATEGIRHPCPKCDKDFSSKVTLAIHDKAVHLKIKQYVCETCGTAFAYQSHLRKHQMVHRDERPFKCSFCDKYFRLTYSRMLHERQHTGKKPYLCTLCSKGYATRARLERHHKAHLKAVAQPAPMEQQIPEVQLFPGTLHEYNPHLTPEMEKHYHQAAEAVVIQEQVTAHSGVPVCNICGIEFASYTDYVNHQQTHSITQLDSQITVNQDVARYHNPDTVSVMLSFMSSAT